MATNSAYSPTHNLNQEMQLVGHIPDEIPAFQGNVGIGDGTNYRFGRRFSLRIENFFQGSPGEDQFGLDEENGIPRTRIQVEGSEQSIIQCFSANHLILNVRPISTEKLKPSKSKTCTIISVTSQLAGSLLGVTKQGSGSAPRVGVQALLYTSALTNAAGFLASLGGLWLFRRRPGAAHTME
ncbi:hypothetical protein GH714_011428 [Hevea brasiliensis]|uniref:Uncharacterized protein n=1 Tax=Hevea brasiliensis TaxID=3981 RepID=A0A6A6LJS8_HEVBR|nr:hypothetical protein GH714_011428 [Hevea brasiliensis]